MTSEEIAKVVYSCRKKSGLSQLQLAQLASVGKTAVFDIEKGKATVQLDTLLKILTTLNINLKLETPFQQTEGSKS
jgi:y4mF family transcriptional regulator